MKHQFLSIVRNLSQTDISTLPNYKTMLAIGRHPEAYFPNPMETAAHIEMDVNDAFVNDPELFKTAVDAYVKTLSRLYDQLKRDMNACEADRVFTVLAQNLTLSYTV